ncbi:MAG TPA: hypothetical protein VF789_01050 [Thermoanaerobaculia bacterium]
MDEETLVAILIPLAFLVGFPLIWIGVCLLSSVLSGWRSLASRYRATTPPAGQRISARFALFGFARYRGIVTAHVSPEGLRLSVLKIFPGHVPLFFPWSDLHDIRAFQPRNGPPGASFRVGPVSDQDSRTIYLPAAVFEQPEVPSAIRAAVSPQARTA